MKSLFTIVMFTFCLSMQAQCEYSVVTYNNETDEAYLQSIPITLDIYETPFNGRILIASLIRIENQYYIEIEITTDSSAQALEPICFKKGARLSFSLKNKSIISISQREDKICGVKFYDEETEYTTVSNYARFILTQNSFDELIKSEVILMKIDSEDYEKTFVVRDELEEVVGEEVIITNPSRFFIDNIECMTNPKFK